MNQEKSSSSQMNSTNLSEAAILNFYHCSACWDWDDEDSEYKFRLKIQSQLSIYQPTISILSGNTHAGFAEHFLRKYRKVFIADYSWCMEKVVARKLHSQKIQIPFLVKELVDRLPHIKKTVVGSASKTKDAHMALDMIYKTWVPLEDGRFKHYSERRFTHLLKLCLVVSAAREHHHRRTGRDVREHHSHIHRSRYAKGARRIR